MSEQDKDFDEILGMTTFGIFATAPTEVLRDAAKLLVQMHVDHMPCSDCGDAVEKSTEENGPNILANVSVVVEDLGNGCTIRASHNGPIQLITAALVELIVQYRVGLGIDLAELSRRQLGIEEQGISNITKH